MKAQLTLVRQTPVKWSGGGRKSKPWTVEELLLVDGMRCTYTIAAEGILVHLPGNKTLPLVVVRAEYRVLDPKCWRAEDYTDRLRTRQDSLHDTIGMEDV